jgi:GH24 family phage-related lysozyme (muramidase)
MAETIAGFEGVHTKVYPDTRKIKTVGVGFNMQQKNARKPSSSMYPSPKSPLMMFFLVGKV